jgi:hypothetical protein
MFGEAPACGIFVRQAKGVRIDRVELACRLSDARSDLALHDVDTRT